MTDLPTRLFLPIDMVDRRFVVCEHSGDTFSEDEDYDGIALTLELKSPEEARAVLGALFGEHDTTHEDLANTEARHAHRDLLAEKDAEIERLTALLEEAVSQLEEGWRWAMDHEAEPDHEAVRGWVEVHNRNTLARIKEPRINIYPGLRAGDFQED